MKLFSFGKCRIVPKNVKGEPFEFFNIHSAAKYQKTRRGTIWNIKKFPKKVAQCRKKSKGGPFRHPRFVGFLEKVKNGRRDPMD